MKSFLLSLGLACACAVNAAPVSFGLIGDYPYNAWERTHLPRLLDEMGRHDLAFVVHDGDIKSGSTECSDAVFDDILGVFQASPHPFVFVPGDNEWTDCHRKNNGAYDPLERLAKLRTLFFPDDTALGKRRLKLERQGAPHAEYRENVRWLVGDGALFVGMNVPGSNNNYFGVTKDRGPSDEYLARGRANHDWLASSFRLAHEKGMKGIVIVIQANPELESRKHNADQPNGYADFIKQLYDETLAFPGQVVLVHGDTHFHRIDQPLKDPATGATIANFTRVETYGSPTLGWVRGVFDADDPKVFRFEARPYQPD